MDISLMSPVEVMGELGGRVRRERLRRNLTQQTLADRAGVSRLTVTRMEAGNDVALTSFLSVLAALQRVGDLDGVLRPVEPQTIDQFVAGANPARQRGRQ